MTEVLQARIVNGQWIGEPFVEPMVLTSRFGEPRNNGVGFHTGEDCAPATGTPGQALRFTSSGAFILWCGVYHGNRLTDNGGYGNVLLLRLANQYQVLLAHLQQFSEPIERWIRAGYDENLKPTFGPNEIVAYQGNTGNVFGLLPDGTVGTPAADDNVSGTHTHLEVRDPQGRLVAPATVLTGVEYLGRESSAPLIF